MPKRHIKFLVRVIPESFISARLKVCLARANSQYVQFEILCHNIFSDLVPLQESGEGMSRVEEDTEGKFLHLPRTPYLLNSILSYTNFEGKI